MVFTCNTILAIEVKRITAYFHILSIYYKFIVVSVMILVVDLWLIVGLNILAKSSAGQTMMPIDKEEAAIYQRSGTRQTVN